MTRNRKIAVAVGAALSLGLAAAVVSAHPGGYGPGGGWGPGHMGGGMGPMGMGYGMGPQGMFYGNPGAAVEGRLAALKSELNITAAQEGAWQAYAAQAKAQAESMQAAMTAMQGAAQSSAPERAALHNEFMKQRIAQAEATNAAFKELYAVLTPEQRSIVDQGPVARGPGFRGPGGRYR